LKLKAGYLFPEIGRRVKAFAQAHPQARIIRLGIGDVTEPLTPTVVKAMHKAVDEMGHKETFHGYDDGGVGYEFLRQAIADHDYQSRGAEVHIDEIFIRRRRQMRYRQRAGNLRADNVVAVTDLSIQSMSIPM